MKKSQPFSVLTLVAIFILACAVMHASTSVAVQGGLAIKEYELFHDVLHPLQHEALPKGDFQRIRMMASDLVARGKAIVKLGIPNAPNAARRKFAETQRKFDRALAVFKSDARTGSNSSLEKSFTVVHDLFEKLADLTPTVYPPGDPPIVSIDCPSGKPEAGSQIRLTARTQAEEAIFNWTVEGGKLLTGQGTPTITIDTTGLAEQTISVRVDVIDRFGYAVMSDCKVQITASKQL